MTFACTNPHSAGVGELTLNSLTIDLRLSTDRGIESGANGGTFGHYMAAAEQKADKYNEKLHSVRVFGGV